LYKRSLKRALDWSLSLIALIFLAPTLVIIAAVVLIDLGRPVLFFQPRPGRDEKVFTLLKFRTMRNTRDRQGGLLPDRLRLTPAMMFLRSLSLDELPELFIILKGDMSFVGPRPLAVQYLPFYSSAERRRHSVRPGLTGLAQINGRNALSWEEKFAFDLVYVERMSLGLDFRIIARTILRVFQRSGIGVRGEDAPPDFDKYRQAQYKAPMGDVK